MIIDFMNIVAIIISIISRSRPMLAHPALLAQVLIRDPL
jgi:hypothetical protein